MKKHVLVAALLFSGFILFSGRMLNAQVVTNELQEGRYVLVMQTGRAVANTRIPAIVLDSYRGVIWTCQNLQDGRPLWVMVDLAKNGDKPMTKKRYIARMLQWQDADLRMPAMVMDADEGIVWNCPNIVDGKATWIEKKLNEDLPKQ
jgi:hypothetical protein